MNYQNIIYPHFDKTKQNKEASFLYCYNVKIVDYRNIDDSGYRNYITGLLTLVASSKKNNFISNQENTSKSVTKQMKYILNRPENGNSAVFLVDYITRDEKVQLDNHLKRTGYTKKIDEFAFVYEGCLNDDKIFLGGKKELIIDYCNTFPNSNYCLKLKNKLSHDSLDNKLNKIFSNPDKTDKLIDEIFKTLETKKI